MHSACTWFLTAFALASLVACAPARVAAVELGPCPVAPETRDDCPWAAMGRTLARDAAANADISAALGVVAKDLTVALDSDARHPEMLALWDRSLAVDELAHAPIVAPGILDALNARAHVAPRDGDRTHAGVQHTYGYLLSTLQTPFGFKRARWVKRDVEQAFSLAAGALGPHPHAGTLLANVTYFAGRIAFRGDAKSRATLERLAAAHAVEPSLTRVAYEELAVTRLTESLALDGRTVSLRTDFVPFPRAVPDGASTHLLVYSVLDSRADGPRLVTVFPVATSFVQRALEPASLGEAMPITTRYNAYVEGVTGAPLPLRGRRGADGPAPP
jgi:hypothetical protein